MSKKERLWHQRMYTALTSHHLAASCLWNQANPADEHDEHETETRAEREREDVRGTELGGEGGRPSMELGRAMDLHQALGARLAGAGEAPLDIIEATALSYLGAVLDCKSIAERSINIAADFESGTITYQGNFDVLRRRMKFGVSMQEVMGFGIPATYQVDIKDVAFQDVAFQQSPPSDSDLRTVRLSGRLSFTLVVVEVEVEEETDMPALLEYLRVVIDPAQAPAPVQRVGLKNPRITHVVVR